MESSEGIYDGYQDIYEKIHVSSEKDRRTKNIRQNTKIPSILIGSKSVQRYMTCFEKQVDLLTQRRGMNLQYDYVYHMQDLLKGCHKAIAHYRATERKNNSENFKLLECGVISAEEILCDFYDATDAGQQYQLMYTLLYVVSKITNLSILLLRESGYAASSCQDIVFCHSDHHMKGLKNNFCTTHSDNMFSKRPGTNEFTNEHVESLLCGLSILRIVVQMNVENYKDANFVLNILPKHCCTMQRDDMLKNLLKMIDVVSSKLGKECKKQQSKKKDSKYEDQQKYYLLYLFGKAVFSYVDVVCSVEAVKIKGVSSLCLDVAHVYMSKASYTDLKDLKAYQVLPEEKRNIFAGAFMEAFKTQEEERTYQTLKEMYELQGEIVECSKLMKNTHDVVFKQGEVVKCVEKTVEKAQNHVEKAVHVLEVASVKKKSNRGVVGGICIVVGGLVSILGGVTFALGYYFREEHAALSKGFIIAGAVLFLVGVLLCVCAIITLSLFCCCNGVGELTKTDNAVSDKLTTSAVKTAGKVLLQG